PEGAPAAWPRRCRAASTPSSPGSRPSRPWRTPARRASPSSRRGTMPPRRSGYGASETWRPSASSWSIASSTSRTRSERPPARGAEPVWARVYTPGSSNLEEEPPHVDPPDAHGARPRIGARPPGGDQEVHGAGGAHLRGTDRQDPVRDQPAPAGLTSAAGRSRLTFARRA